VEKTMWHPREFAGLSPSPTIIPDLFPLPMKDVGTEFYTLCPPPVNDLGDFSYQNDDSAIFILGDFRS
jgi:hypothetical protein